MRRRLYGSGPSLSFGCFTWSIPHERVGEHTGQKVSLGLEGMQIPPLPVIEARRLRHLLDDTLDGRPCPLPLAAQHTDALQDNVRLHEEIAVPPIFSATGWCHRLLSSQELHRAWDLPSLVSWEFACAYDWPPLRPLSAALDALLVSTEWSACATPRPPPLQLRSLRPVLTQTYIPCLDRMSHIHGWRHAWQQTRPPRTTSPRLIVACGMIASWHCAHDSHQFISHS